jgi:hypothetical protein
MPAGEFMELSRARRPRVRPSRGPPAVGIFHDGAFEGAAAGVAPFDVKGAAFASSYSIEPPDETYFCPAGAFGSTAAIGSSTSTAVPGPAS